MNGVMRLVCYANQVVKIQSTSRSVQDVLFVDRVHVVHDNSIMNLMSFDSEITTFISRYDVVTKATPFTGCIELLIDPTITAEGRTAYFSTNGKVVEPFFERFQKS